MAKKQKRVLGITENSYITVPSVSEDAHPQ